MEGKGLPGKGEKGKAWVEAGVGRESSEVTVLAVLRGE